MIKYLTQYISFQFVTTINIFQLVVKSFSNNCLKKSNIILDVHIEVALFLMKHFARGHEVVVVIAMLILSFSI